jgi:hypothetical protein
MTKEDKYYTPEIEEFHPNFEYEFNSYGQGFVETEVSETGGFFQGEKRVKYLDREDIESFGFDFKEEHRFSKIYSKHNEAIEIREDGEVRIGLINYGINDCVDKITIWFRGTIKNKSELKKVLKMIGYEN